MTGNEGDECYIDCGWKSCDNTTTRLYCYGKCFVTCESDEYCPEIVISLPPTVSPTKLPTYLPTYSPTPKKETIYLTTKDVSIWFNWTLGIFVGLIIIVILIGCIDYKNDLFEAATLLVVAFYTIDFISGMFHV